MYLTIDLVGGLGNQLFGIATAYSLARRNNCTLIFKRNSSSPSVFSNRDTYWDSLFSNLTSTRRNIKTPMTIAEKKPSHLQSFPKLTSDTKLTGYFQNYRYFINDIQLIRSHIFSQSSLDTASSLVERYLKSHIFLHFRRGDYKRITSRFNILPISYYEGAVLDLISEFQHDIKLLIFCEDGDKAEVINDLKSSSILSSYEFELIDNVIPDDIQLLMMAEMPNGGVIANSTYSLWAGYVGAADKYIVPGRWRTRDNENTDTFNGLISGIGKFKIVEC